MITTWDFENINMSGGPVSTFLLGSDFANHGIPILGWTEDSALFVGNASHHIPNYVGGNSLFTFSPIGESVYVVVFNAPVDSITLTFAQPTIGDSVPAWEFRGALGGTTIDYRSYETTISSGNPHTITISSTIDRFSVSTHNSLYGMPLDGYIVPATGSITLICAAMVAMIRRHNR